MTSIIGICLFLKLMHVQSNNIETLGSVIKVEKIENRKKVNLAAYRIQKHNKKSTTRPSIRCSSAHQLLPLVSCFPPANNGKITCITSPTLGVIKNERRRTKKNIEINAIKKLWNK